MALPQTQVSLQLITDGISDFNTHYTLLDGSAVVPGFLTVSWPDFKNAVENNGGIQPLQQIALKFIHRFVAGTGWFLTMECNKMDLTNGQIIATGNRFDIVNNTIILSAFKGNVDPTYFANILCDDQPITPNTYVSSMIFPYFQQLSEVHCQNLLPDNDPTVFINFASCSFDYTTLPNECLVPFPHGLSVYMSATGHGDYLDDNSYTRMFTNRAADYATMCPPRCNVCSWPPGLPPVAICRI